MAASINCGGRTRKTPERTTDPREATGKLSHIHTLAESETRTRADTGVLGCQYSGTFDPCSTGNHMPFPYMLDRCPACEYVSNDRSDLFDLNHDIWYSTNLNITTRYISPYGCGTRIPIWMDGSIPVIGDGVVDRKACAATFTNTCAIAYSLKVKRCDMSTVIYCVQNLPSSIQQRYCFDFDPQTNTSTTTPTPFKSQNPQNSVSPGGQQVIVTTVDGTQTWVIVVIVSLTVVVVVLIVLIIVILQRIKRNHREHRPHSCKPPSYIDVIGAKWDKATVNNLESK